MAKASSNEKKKSKTAAEISNYSRNHSTNYFPIQLDIQHDKARLLYFKEEVQRKIVLDLLLREQGFTSQFD